MGAKIIILIFCVFKVLQCICCLHYQVHCIFLLERFSHFSNKNISIFVIFIYFNYFFNVTLTIDVVHFQQLAHDCQSNYLANYDYTALSFSTIATSVRVIWSGLKQA